MLSEKQHIDDYYRQKEEAFTPDEQHATAHWQQMQKQLADPGPGASANNKNGSQTIRQIGKFLGGLLTVAIIAILAIKVNRPNKKATTKTTKQQVTIVAPETKRDTLSNTSQTTNGATTIVTTKTTSASIQKPQHVPAMTLVAPPVTRAQETLTQNHSIEYNGLEQSANKTTNETKNNNPDAQALLRTFFDELKKEEQAFFIEAERDTTLIAKEGTQLIIPASTFNNKTGIVKGKVKIIIREYLQYDDIIANKLTTTSNKEQLVTGGMLHISAEQDNQPVAIAPQKAINVSIPTSYYDNRMMLFTGTEQAGDIANTSTINWIAQEPLHLRSDVHQPMVKTLNLSTVQPVSVNYGKKTTAKFYLNYTVAMPKPEIIAQLKQRFGSYYDNIKIKRIRNKKIRRRSANEEQLVIQVVNMDPNKVDKKISVLKDSLRYDNNVKRDTFDVNKKMQQQEYYRFIINSMGWVNCDCFRNAPRPRGQLNVKLGNDIPFTNCASQLVFTRYKSVMYPNYGYGNKIQFQSLPAGDEAVLVTVAVKDGNLVSSFVPLTISGKDIDNMTFEPTTPAQFKQKLHSLFASQQQ